MQEIIILADSARGVYIPQHFAETIRRELVQGVSDQDFIDLMLDPYGNDGQILWETWTRVLDNAKIVSGGVTYVLCQDGDLFAIPENQLDSWLEDMS